MLIPHRHTATQTHAHTDPRTPPCAGSPVTPHGTAPLQIVINLIGANYETRNFSYDDVHATWPRHLAQLAKESPLLER